MRESTPTAATVRSALPRRSAAAWLALLLAAAAPAAAQSTGQWAEVTAGAAVVMDGKVKLADVRQGERLRVIEARPPWILVAVTVDGAERRGWIQAAQVRLIDAEPQGADPAPPPASAPSARPWVRVVSEQTPIMLGSQQLGVLRRGELRQLLDANGAWRRVAVRRGGRRDVGWVAAQDVEPLDPGAAGPSQAGDEPASITAPRLAIDWSTESVTLTLEPPLAADGEAQLARALPTVAGSAQRPTLMREGDRLSITLEGDNLLDLFAPGTRSLWVGEQTGAERRMHRVDFPAPQLGTVLSVYRYPDFPEGIVVHVPAEGLLPGYVLEYAYGEWPAENGYWPIARTKGALPRLADLRQGDQGVELRVIVPYAAAGFGDAPLALRVRAADGSISNAIVVRRRQDEVAKTASQIAEAAAAPVDATIEAPAVEWLPVEEALAALRAAGLRETLVHNRSLAPISAAEAAGGTVQRQGVEPGGAVLAGGELVLAVAAADPWGGAPLTSGVEIDDPGRSRPAAIDAADDFGFVDPDGVWPRIPLAADADGGLSDAGGSGGFPGPAGIDLATLDVTTFALHADPGVPIVPHRDERTATLAAMVRLMLDALWARPEWRNLPSDIGRALTAAIAEQELPLRELLALPEPLADGALDPVVDLTLATLAVELPPDARDALRGDARDFVARRPTFSRLDRNNNGVVADDVVAWVLDWLVRRGLYDPAGQTVIADGGPGTLIAIVPPDDPGVDWPPPDWIDEWPPPIDVGGTPPGTTPPGVAPPGGATPPGTVPGGGGPGPTGPGGATGPGTTAGGPGGPPAPPGDIVPPGDAVVERRDGPDEVRVPKVLQELVSAVVDRTGALGLLIASVERLLQTDRVTASDPAENAWTAAGTALRLTVVRRVPDVRKLSREQAEAVLAERKFTMRAAADSQPGDIIIAQAPAAGELAPTDAPVEVTAAVLVPHLVGKLQPEVMSLLKTKNLPWRSPTRTNSVDKVVEQRPGAGVLWDRRQPMDLVWHVPVPELGGTALARGRERLTELDLRIEVQTRLARDPDVIRGQQPRAGTFVPHGSRVVVGPVLGRVPRVVGQGVGPAAALLTDREDYPAERLGPLLDSDIVTRQNPQAGAEYERGRTVTLDARVTVPNVRGQNLDRALQAVRSAGGALAPVVAGASGRGDVVFSQQPGPNELVYPRTTVTLVPGVQVPDVRRQTPQQAAAILASAGLDSQVVSSSTQETTNRAQVGATVVDNQRPGPGLYRRTDVRRVELSVVQFVPATRVVPNVIEFTVQQAIAAIKRAELVPIIVVDGREMNEATFAAYALTQTILQEGGNSSVYQLTVGTQNPRAGASVMLGSQVRIGVALPRY